MCRLTRQSRNPRRPAEFADAEMPAGVEEPPRPLAQTGVAPQPMLPAQVMRHVHLFWAAMTLIIAMLGFMTYRMVETPVERDAIPAVSSESRRRHKGRVRARNASACAYFRCRRRQRIGTRRRGAQNRAVWFRYGRLHRPRLSRRGATFGGRRDPLRLQRFAGTRSREPSSSTCRTPRPARFSCRASCHRQRRHLRRSMTRSPIS